MHSRIRAPEIGGRKKVIPIRFSEKEYKLIVNAANSKGYLVGTFIANIAMREAAKIVKNKS